MAAAVDALHRDEPAFADGLFRVRKKNGEYRIVDAPDFGGALLADAHTHVQYLGDPAMAIARAGLHGVDFLCTAVDVAEDDESVLSDVQTWTHRAAVNMQRVVGRGC